MKNTALVFAIVFVLIATGCRKQSKSSGGSAATSQSATQNTATLTAEYLLAHGFTKDGDWYICKNVKLGQVATDLGFSPKDLRGVVNCKAEDDMRCIETGGAYIRLEATTEIKNGEPISPPNQLNDVEAICDAFVFLNYVRVDKKTPQIAISSVVVPSDGVGPIKVQCQITAQSEISLARIMDFLCVDLSRNSEIVFSGLAKVVAHDEIAMIPAGQSTTLLLEITKDRHVTTKTWLDLPPGNYLLTVNLKAGKIVYEYGRSCSEPWPVTIAKKK